MVERNEHLSVNRGKLEDNMNYKCEIDVNYRSSSAIKIMMYLFAGLASS